MSRSANLYSAIYKLGYHFYSTNKVMKNIFPYTKPRKYKHCLEIVETEISDWQSKTYLPRHMSAPETKSHRDRRSANRISNMPKICHIELERQNNANLAVDILQYQISDCSSRQKHLKNLRHNLERRLQVAKSQGNSQLLHLLQAEYQQLETSI